MAGTGRARTLGDVVGTLVDETRTEDTLTLGALLEALGPRAYGPLLLVPSLVALVPIIGAIPGISVVTGTIIVLVAGQLSIGRRAPWLPPVLLRLPVPKAKLAAALRRIGRGVSAVDRVVHPRLAVLVQPPMLQIDAAALVVQGVLFHPTALIPWGVTVPSLAATLIALAITTQDGLLALLGLAASAASLYVVVAFWPF